MRLSQIQQFFSRDIVRLLMFIEKNECSYTFGEAYRTKEQAEIYAANGKGIKNSLHCQRLAMDINIFNQKGDILTTVSEYEPYATYWESLNPKNRAGAFFKDRPDADHFERNEKPS
jgi:hypothetical protein